MNIDRFWLLAGRHIAGEATPEEEKEFNAGLEQYPDYKLRYDALKSFWGESKQRDAIDVEKAYQKVKARLDVAPIAKGRVKNFYPLLFKIAAVLVVGVLLGYIALTVNVRKEWEYVTWQEKHNEKGERSEITLPDGSKVWLNADSQLKFPNGFSALREVYLSGEAFFDVKKNPVKPFIIHLKKGNIRVLGTSFNVKSFDDDRVIETSVVSGKVAFIPVVGRQQEDTLYLTQNTKAIYNKESGKSISLQANSADDRSWIDGKIIFRSSSLEEVGKVLERAYGKKIILDNPSLKNCKLTATFQNNVLEEIIEMIAATKDFQYTSTEKELHINGSGCTPHSN
jgi:transmembrane sensor